MLSLIWRQLLPGPIPLGVRNRYRNNGYDRDQSANGCAVVADFTVIANPASTEDAPEINVSWGHDDFVKLENSSLLTE